LGTLVAVCGGCSWYHAPDLDVVSVQRAQETDEGMVLSFGLDASNENEVALPLKTVRYSLELEGKRVFSGRRAAEATLRRKGTQRILLPAAVPWEKIGGEAPAGDVPYRLSGELSYVTPGQLAEILFDTGVRRPSVRFSEKGVIAFSPGGDATEGGAAEGGAPDGDATGAPAESKE
jgi:hypothetical protein